MDIRPPKELLLIVIACVVSLGVLRSQGYEAVTLIQNTSFHQTFEGFTPIFIKSPHNGTASSNTQNGEIFMSYTPDPDFTGKDSLVMQYRTGPAPRGDVYYVGFAFDVRASVISPTVDYHLMYKDAGPDTLSVLDNDYSSAGGLVINDLPVISSGTASIVDDSLVQFQPSSGFTGLVQLEYRVCDTFASCMLGQLIVQVVDTATIALIDTIERSVKANHSVEILLPAANFVLQSQAENGDVTFTGDYTIEYHPDEDFVGTDSFQMKAGQLVRQVIIYVLPYDEPNDFLVDDVIYTAEGVSVNFDVQQNDLVEYRFKIKSYTSPDEGTLTYAGDGVFNYEPPADFEGLKTFSYTVCPSLRNCETAEVKIFISNSKPENTFNYKFNTLKNVPLVIDYKVPIDYFEFDEQLEPVHGVLDIYDGISTIHIECDTITGNNLVVYTPDTDFHGQDEFELLYSIPQTGYSAAIKVEVNVINAMPDSTCACINGCVWPGDVDYDGRVTMKDLLPLGYMLGLEGPERDNGQQNYWIGEYCDDWNALDNAWEINPKHADTDGSGQINALDTQAISTFYYSEHNLVERDISLPRKFPLTMTPLFTELDSGETAIILVGIGTREFPAYDLSGFTYSYFYDPSVVDSGSLNIQFHKDSWFTDQSPVLDLYKQPWDGRVDAGFTRTGGKVTTGFGVVSTLSFGVEEDLEGIRKLGEDRLVTVKLDEGYAMNGAGELFQIPGAEIKLRLTGKSDNPDSAADPKKLAVFPNPTNGVVQAFLNGSNHLKSAEVYSVTGQKLMQIHIGHSQKAELDLGSLQNGFYLVRFETTRGPVVKKVQILR